MATYQTLKETDDQDLSVENGDLVLIEDQEVIRQQLETNYRLSKNDWFLNLDEGIRYFGNERGIIGNRIISEENRADLITTGVNTVGIRELSDISFEFNITGELETTIVVITEFAPEETTTTVTV